MNPQDQDPSGNGNPQNVQNPLAAMQPGEQVICEIKRHPIGMITMYIITGVMLVVLAIIAFAIAPSFLGDSNRNSVLTIGTLTFLVVAVLSIVYLFIANIVYWGNRWIVTSDSITQINQRSLFDKQSSQLSLGNLEDVTTEKNGILAHMFNYGHIKAETAGERSKFTLIYCPNPDSYAQQILHAREVFEQGHRGGKMPAENQNDYPNDVNTNTQQ